MKRKRYTKEFKAKVALEAIKGQKTINEITSEFGVHTSQINEWKRQLQSGMPQVFDRQGERREAANEGERDRLYCQIGKLQVEVDWLKKRPDISDERAREACMYGGWASSAEHRPAVRTHWVTSGEPLPRDKAHKAA